ncbi:MAG: hypothetical protein AAGJ40_22800 [Planctomycetota bacterium]
MIRYLIILIVLMSPIGKQLAAWDPGPCCCFCNQGHCRVEVGHEEVEETRFDCESVAICIPPLRFPWERGPLKKCGKVRVIQKLTKTKVTKHVCTYDWSAIACCPKCRQRVLEGGCDSGCCDAFNGEASCCDAGDFSGDGQVSSEDRPLAPAMQLPARHRLALVEAIREAPTDDAGWARVPAMAVAGETSDSLTSDVGLMDVMVESLSPMK